MPLSEVELSHPIAFLKDAPEVCGSAPLRVRVITKTSTTIKKALLTWKHVK